MFVAALAVAIRRQDVKYAKHSIWPVALLGSVVLVTVAWIGFLGFTFFKLIDRALL